MIHLDPDLSRGVTTEKDGRRLFLRLWPSPTFLEERQPDLWSDVADVRDDFNLTGLLELRDTMRARVPEELSSLATSIACGQYVLKESYLPVELKPLFRVQQRINRKQTLLDTVPRNILGRIRCFPESHFALLQLFADHPEAMTLAESNPLLVFLLAAHREWTQQNCVVPRDAIRNALRGKRKSILRWLGFPNADESLVRLLGKADAWACRSDLVAGFQEVLRDGRAIKRLRHLPAINLGCMAIAADKTLLDRVSDGLLREVADDETEDHSPVTALRLRAFLAMEEQCYLPALPRMFYTRRRIQKELFAVADYLALEEFEAMQITLPDPPLLDTPTIEALRTPEDVHTEGWEQGYFVWDLLPMLLSGKMFLYRVLAPERATVAIKRGKDGLWQVLALKGRGNEPVSHKTEHAVQCWIDDCGKPHSDVM